MAPFKTRVARLRDSAEVAVADAMPNWIEKILVHRTRRQSTQVTHALPRGGSKRLFVDVSVVSVNDAGTGIQRVVRGVSTHLRQLAAASQWDVAFVAGTRTAPYRTIDPVAGRCIDAPMHGRPGDVFIGLDYALDAIPPNFAQLRQFRRQGGELWFFVHDLLPLQRPDWFSKQTSQRYLRWLRVLASIADGFFCNSSQTEAELKQVLAKRFVLTEGFRTCVLPMGADLSRPIGFGKEIRTEELPTVLLQKPFVLMVGTLEPRKGHADVLSAFERLWETEDTPLVIVGRPGWKVEQLQKRLKCHPFIGKHLFWFDDADDELLAELYSTCEGVVVAALAEGFGLPLLEALGYCKPVLARDLPVFRQHHPRGVRYFAERATSDELASCISRWLSDVRTGAITVTPEQFSWQQTTEALLLALGASSLNSTTEGYIRYVP